MDYTKFTTEELENTLKQFKEQIASMIMNPNLTKLIAEVEILEFMLKTRKEDGQQDTEVS